MAIPRVFISSTCYDLKHIRENLKYFVKTIGYEPVLSEDGDVFYGPSNHTHDACLKEVQTCQIFVLVIGGRYGGQFNGSDSSITNNEYREALSKGSPVFALVESAVYSDHHLYSTNIKRDKDLALKIDYPSSDSTKIFEFIDEVRRQSENNAIFPFKDFSDMEAYLRKQWAGMMYDFLDHRENMKHSEITNKLLDDLTLATRKSEELMKVLLRAASGNSADQSINKISNYVHAETFIKNLHKKFDFEEINTDFDVQNFIKKRLPNKWIDFILSIDGFRDESFPGENDELIRVLWGPSARGIQIGTYNEESQLIDDEYSELDKGYEAFKAIDVEERKELIFKLVNGF